MRQQSEATHRWNVTPSEARKIQEQVRHQVICTNEVGEIHRVAGVDVGFEQKNTITRAAVAVLDFPSLTLIEHSIARRPTSFPYIPGLLSFREIPTVLDALDQTNNRPDVLLCDGQGIAHPRRLGIASHLGVVTGLPSIGVAKSRLTGRHAPVPNERGKWVPLTDGEETIGAVLRTRTGVKPLYISIGHKVNLATSLDLVLRCLTGYRLPETTRWADRLASNRRGRSERTGRLL